MSEHEWLLWSGALRPEVGRVNATNWYQSMSGFSGVAHSGLRLAGGTLQIGIRASVQHLAWMGQRGSVEVNIHRRITLK